MRNQLVLSDAAIANITEITTTKIAKHMIIIELREMRFAIFAGQSTSKMHKSRTIERIHEHSTTVPGILYTRYAIHIC